MGQGKRVLRCIRCGEALQTTNPKAKGYISPDFINGQQKITAVYCNECYNAVAAINARVQCSQDDQKIINYFKKIKKSKSVIVYVLDLFSYAGIIEENILPMAQGVDVVVIATRKNILGSYFNEKKITNVLSEILKKNNINLLKVFAIDKNDGSMDKAIDSFKRNFIDGKFKGRDVYVAGRKGSGKTALVSTFLKKYSNQSNENVHAVWVNKDLKATIIPLGQGNKLYDLPDFSNNNSVISKVEKPVQNLLVPKESIDSHGWSLKTGDALQIGSLAGFEVTNGELTYYKYYCARTVECKKVASSKFNDSFKNNMITKLLRPVSSNLINMLDFEVFEFEFEKDGIYHEIAAEGLGFVVFKGVGQTIRVCVPKGVYVGDNLGRV